MNPEKPSREEIEAKLTALLLGELPAEEAQLLRWAISQDAELKKLHDRLQFTIGLVREVATHPADATPAQTVPLKLSDERREKLLAHFKTIAPKEFTPLVPPLKKRREISPLLAMAAAIALIAVLAAMLLPALSKAKNKAQRSSYMSMKENIAVAQNSPATITPPQAASEQRLESAEAYFQNGSPASNGGDAWKKQTAIVLPAGGTDDKELAAASPAPSSQFTFGLGETRDQNVIVTRNAFLQMPGPTSPLPQDSAPAAGGNHLGFASSSYGNNNGGGGADTDRFLIGGDFTENGTMIDRVARINTDGSLDTNFVFNNGFGGGGGGRGGGGDAWQTPAVSPPEAGNRDEFFAAGLTKDDVSGARYLHSNKPITSDAQNQIAAKSQIYDSPAPGAPADKVPLPGDVPAMGSLFKSSANRNDKVALDSVAPASAVVANVGGMVGLYSFTKGSSEDLSKSGTGALALNGNNSYNGVATFSGGTLSVAKDGNGNLGYDNSGQLERNRRIDQLGVATPTAPTDAPAASSRTAYFRLVDPSAPAPTVAPPAPHILLGPIPNEQETSVTLNYATTLPPTVASSTVAAAPPVTVAQNAIVSNNGWIGRIHNQEVNSQLQPQSATDEDRPIQKAPSPAPIPTPEILTRENAFSTFSLNVSDVSFKLAAASLERGQLPDAASIRSEEFINAFDYRDPEPAAGVPVAFVAERARDPFAHNRDLLRFSIKTAAAGREPGRPLNIVLLLDNSGSMERADRVAIIHEALKVLASQLQPQDTLSIVTFARTARLWVDGARGDQAGAAVNKVSALVPEGGTNLEEAMNLAYATARRHYLANGGNRVVLLTDGAANLGNVDPEALKQKVESFRKQGIALDCFGIGWEGYNDDLLEVLSSNGDGRYGFINTPEAATTEFAAQLAGALHVAAEDVKVQVEFNPARVISYRQIGYAKHQLTKEQFRDNTVAAAPLAAREAGNALYTVEINPQGSGPVATVRVRFRIPGKMDVSEHEWQVPFDGTAPALEKSSPALRLAATAGAFSEWLASSPFAQEVTTDQLLNYLNGVPAIYGADARPKQLETMIREAKSLSGK